MTESMEEFDSIKEILKPFGVRDFSLEKIYLYKKMNLQSYAVKRWRETFKKRQRKSFTQESLQSAFKRLREFDGRHEPDLVRQGKIQKVKSDLDIVFDCIQYMPPNWVLQVSHYLIVIKRTDSTLHKHLGGKNYYYFRN